MPRTARVLVVDDEKKSCTRCSEVLGTAGCEVSTTSDPLQGLELLENEHYDLVLMDMKSPPVEGETYLRSLRRRDPGATVIVLADRPNVDDAIRSMKDGATDFLVKPFEDAKLLHLVEHELIRTSAADVPTPVLDEGLETHAWRPASQECLFRHEMWLQRGEHGSRRVGLFMPHIARKSLVLEALVRPGERLCEGLPFAIARREDGQRFPLLAPINGRVLEVKPRPAQAEVPSLASEDWILRIQPGDTALPKELVKHQVVLLDPGPGTEHVAALRALGLVVRKVSTPKEALHALHCDRCELLVANATTLGVEGPTGLRWMRGVLPDVRVVTIGDAEANWEAPWRAEGISYYAAPPVDGAELSDLFAGMLACPPQPRPRKVRTHRHVPPFIHAVETTNGKGRRVAVLVADATLPADHGVGLHFVNGLLNACRPVTTRFGECSSSRKLLRESLRDYDRVVELQIGDNGAVPGSLLPPAEKLSSASGDPRVTTLAFQCAPGQPDTLAFDDRTSAAVAAHVLRCVETR